MIPWIQVYSNLPTHPKTARLAEELHLKSADTSPNLVAAGILIGLWTWAVQSVYDGDLSACSPGAIADACRWKRKPELLISALKKSGYLDADMRLHDWDEYAALLINAEDSRKEKTRERVKRYRDKRRSDDEAKCNAHVTVTDDDDYGTDGVTCNGDCNVTCNVTQSECNGYGNVTETPCNAHSVTLRKRDVTPLHNHTIHNITLPYTTTTTITSSASSPATTDFCGGGGEDDPDNGAVDNSVENPVENYCGDCGVSYERHFAAEDVSADVKTLTQQIISELTSRQPTKVDEAQVFKLVTRCEQDEQTKAWHRWIDSDARDLLIHAFRLAAESGKAGDWRYITGILRRMHARGIATVSDAEDYDVDRDYARDRAAEDGS